MAGLPPGILPIAGVTDCDPEVQATTSTVFLVRNRKKPGNFIMASISPRTGFLSYHVQNLPKDGRGCPGRWLFQLAWDHFLGLAFQMTGIRSEWTFGDNLDRVNALTQGGQMLIADAAQLTWAGARALERGLTSVTVLAVDGIPGQYQSVDVLFSK